MIEVETDAEQDMAEKLSARLEAFGNSLTKKRDEAIAGRKASGIEEEWELAEEAYQGIDDANRGSSGMGKPSSPYGGYVNGKPAGSGTRSTILLNITRSYVDAAAARVGDMLLPTDDRNWSIKPTPIPDSMLMGFDRNQIQGAIQEIEASAKQSAEGAQKQIDDWLVGCQWHSEVRKLIEECARLGTGVMKGPFPDKVRSRVTQNQNGILAMVTKEVISPHSKCVSPWNVYPDPDCGENIHDGSYIWEKDTITAKRIRDLKGLPGYIDHQIDKVLEQGPKSPSMDSSDRGQARDSDVYEIWYYYGVAEKDDLEAAGVDVGDGLDSIAHCIVTTINGIVVRAALEPLESGAFPFDFMPWQRKKDQPWGTGVAIQINAPQKMLTAAVRNMMDNAGLSGGPQIVVRKSAIQPADGTWALTPRKFWWVNESADMQAVQQAIMAINIPTMQVELTNIVNLALKMAEDVTGLPMLMQGQAGAATPDTVGGMQMLNNNASAVLRRIARLYDDRITEPHIRRYYDWLMEYGENSAIKGDFQVDARGSSALVERDIQNQAILQMGQMVMNPAFGVDPQKWFEEALKAQRLDPKRFLMDEEKRAQMQQQPAPVAPQIEAAKIRAEVEMQKLQASMQQSQMALQADVQLAQMQNQAGLQKAQMQNQAAVEKMRLDTDRDSVYVQAQHARDQANAQAKMAELQIKRELAMLEYAMQEKLTLEQVKAKLAEAAAKINLTRELASMKATSDVLPKPPIEPPGRAPVGESFTK